jgi:hypothetical protein
VTDSRLTKKRVAIALVVLAFVIGGLLATRPPPDRPDWARCTPNAPFACTVLDGVALGELRRSWDVNAVACPGDCPQPIDVARAELELRAPGHPAVKAIGEYAPDRLALCGEVLCAYSGYLGIFVFDVGDARPRPIVVSCPGVAACRVIGRYGEANG